MSHSAHLPAARFSLHNAGGQLSIGRGAVDAVDDEDLDGIPGGDQLDAKLFFESYGERGSVGSAGGAGVAQGRPGEVRDVEVAGEAGVVDYWTVPGVAQLVAHQAAEPFHRGGPCAGGSQPSIRDHRHHCAGTERIAGVEGDGWVTGFALGRRGDFGDLEAAFGGYEPVDGENRGLER